CRSLEYRLVPLPDGLQIVACNTMVKHGHAGGEYNRRRAESEEGVQRLAAVLPGVGSLRDVTLEQLEEHRGLLPQKIFRRCRHVITENARVLQAAGALEREDLGAVGRLMAESHRSLRDDYEVSAPELDVMVELAGKQTGVAGARMMGGGFGGCTINLVRAEQVEEFRSRMTQAYEKSTGLRPEIYLCSASQGAGRVQESI
ncbi:MAG TPA: hypothetical protein VK473_17865, partial [Terriglobales bacterium]|nr:hypothetical protein [Terriglobales bacterium]